MTCTDVIIGTRSSGVAAAKDQQAEVGFEPGRSRLRDQRAGLESVQFLLPDPSGLPASSQQLVPGVVAERPAEQPVIAERAHPAGRQPSISTWAAVPERFAEHEEP
jgi:hypothetical protein